MATLLYGESVGNNGGWWATMVDTREKLVITLTHIRVTSDIFVSRQLSQMTRLYINSALEACQFHVIHLNNFYVQYGLRQRFVIK